MKKIMLSMCGGCALLLASCSGDDDAARSISLESFSYESYAELDIPDSLLSDAEGSRFMQCRGAGMLPVAGKNEKLVALRDSLIRMASVEFTDKGECAPVLDADLKVVKLSADSVAACGLNTNMLTVVLATPEAVVWEDFSYAYMCGAAHGNSAYSYLNYSLGDGSILSLDDLMVAGYRDALTELLRSRLSDREDLFEDAEIGVPGQFRITPDGLQFIYQQYEIAPYSSGVIRVDLTAYELGELLSARGRTLILGD